MLALGCGKERRIPFRNSADKPKLLPGSRLTAVKEPGHVPMQEAPAQTLSPLHVLRAASTFRAIAAT